MEDQCRNRQVGEEWPQIALACLASGFGHPLRRVAEALTTGDPLSERGVARLARSHRVHRRTYPPGLPDDRIKLVDDDRDKANLIVGFSDVVGERFKEDEMGHACRVCQGEVYGKATGDAAADDGDLGAAGGVKHSGQVAVHDLRV